jgi:L-malate glycosyltransferase
LRILFLSHTSQVSGAERSLLDLIGALPAEVSARLACPEGDLATRAEHLGLEVLHLRGILSGSRLRGVHIARAVRELVESTAGVRRMLGSSPVSLLHANSLRAGLMATVVPHDARKVVHVRDCVAGGVVPSTAVRLGTARAAAVVANSRRTADSLRAHRPHTAVTVVHGGVDHRRFDPRRHDRERARAGLGFEPDTLGLGLVAQITPWKGHRDALAAVARLKDSGLRCRLLIVGAPKFTDPTTRYDNLAYLAELKALMRAHGLERQVSFLGEREDVPEVLSALDVLLAPSWEEPFGKSVLEGMSMALPVIATSMGGPREVIADGYSGLLVPPRRPDLLATRIVELGRDPARRHRIGASARRCVEERFSLQLHADRMLGVFERALAA